MIFYKILSYVYNALAFVFDAELEKKIKTIYLFGSAVREEITASSDIDLFVECTPLDESFIQKRAEANLTKFYKSNDFEKWQRLGVTNPISINVGQPQLWELWPSIQSEGFVLYDSIVKELGGKFERKVLIIFRLPKSKPKYLKITRKLFGREEYKQPGFLKGLGGERISANTIIVPQKNLTAALQFLQKNKIKYKLIQFYTQK